MRDPKRPPKLKLSWTSTTCCTKQNNNDKEKQGTCAQRKQSEQKQKHEQRRKQKPDMTCYLLGALQELFEPFGPETPLKSKKVPRVKKESKWSLKKIFSTYSTFFGSFQPLCRQAPENLFSTFVGFLARRGRMTSVRGPSDRKNMTLFYHFCLV